MQPAEMKTKGEHGRHLILGFAGSLLSICAGFMTFAVPSRYGGCLGRRGVSFFLLLYIFILAFLDRVSHVINLCLCSVCRS